MEAVTHTNKRNNVLYASRHLCVVCFVKKKALSKMESATIQRQRRELQLLIAELKDRDQELNTMAAAHHQQLQAWEQDRQRVLSLEQRCTRLEGENRDEMMFWETIRIQMNMHLVK